MIHGKEELRRALETRHAPHLVVAKQSSLAELRGILSDEALETPVAFEEVAPWERSLPWQSERRPKKLIALRNASHEP